MKCQPSLCSSNSLPERSLSYAYTLQRGLLSVDEVWSTVKTVVLYMQGCQPALCSGRTWNTWQVSSVPCPRHQCKSLVLGLKLRLVYAARHRGSAGHAGNADTGTSACRVHRLHSRQSGRLAPRQRSLQARPGRQRLAAAPVAEAAVAEKPESAQQSAVRSAAHAVFSYFPPNLCSTAWR